MLFVNKNRLVYKGFDIWRLCSSLFLRFICTRLSVESNTTIKRSVAN